MQREEGNSEVLIAIVDESYPPPHDDLTEELSQAFQRVIENEFQCHFEESNIGPGFDIPAFETFLRENLIPSLLWLLAAFFSGKPVLDNVGAWRQISQKIRSFFSRKVVLSRNGAAALVIEHLMDEIGGTPKSIRLLGYCKKHISDEEDELWGGSIEQIERAPPTINLGLIIHRFEIEADGVAYTALVDGKKVSLRKQSSVL